MTGDQLARLRKSRGLTLRELARLLGLSGTRALRRWEAGSAPIPEGVIAQLEELSR